MKTTDSLYKIISDMPEGTLLEMVVADSMSTTTTVSGRISVVGNDFLSILSAIERTEETTTVDLAGAQDKPDQRIIVYETETFINFCDIKLITRILKSIYK